LLFLIRAALPTTGLLDRAVVFGGSGEPLPPNTPRVGDFEVLEQAKAHIWRSKGTAGKKQLQICGPKILNGCILNPGGKPKMEIPVERDFTGGSWPTILTNNISDTRICIMLQPAYTVFNPGGRDGRFRFR
jgi:hypothetical protein